MSEREFLEEHLPLDRLPEVQRVQKARKRTAQRSKRDDQRPRPPAPTGVLATAVAENIDKIKPHSTFTPNLGAKIVELVQQGNYLSVAARAAGVPDSTVQSWIEAGEKDPSSAYGPFAALVLAAEAEVENTVITKMLDVIDETKQWAGWMTYLERRFPDRWKRKSDKSSITVNVGILEQRVHELAAEAEVIYDGD